MIYRRSSEFKKAYQELPEHIQEKVKKAFALFKENPQHPSLGTKKIKGREGIWEGRVNQFYRFTFEYIEDSASGETTCLFRMIGRHEIVDHNP